jgi:hypothetical protein
MRRVRQPPSWLGTLIVAIAAAVMCIRAAVQLRAGVAPAPAAPARSTAPSGE